MWSESVQLGIYFGIYYGISFVLLSHPAKCFCTAYSARLDVFKHKSDQPICFLTFILTQIGIKGRFNRSVYFSFFLGRRLLVCPHFFLRQLTARGCRRAQHLQKRSSEVSYESEVKALRLLLFMKVGYVKKKQKKEPKTQSKNKKGILFGQQVFIAIYLLYNIRKKNHNI